jgi:hypothetical protein
MDNRLKLYVFLLILIFVGIAFFEVNRPKEIDWQPYYTTAKKSPYGLYIFNKEIGKIFKNQKIEKLNETPYEFFDNSFDYDSSVFNYSKKGTYFSVEKDNELDDESAAEILYFVSHGNEAFISASSLSYVLLDSLNLTLGSAYSMKDSVKVYLDHVDSNIYSYNKINYVPYFDSIDSTVMGFCGHIKVKNNDTIVDYVNFIRLGYGNGYIYLHLMPEIFTNYHLLKGKNHQLVASVLSFLQNSRPIYWDTKQYSRDEKADTPLRVILSYPSLRWAWYFLLIGFLIYLLFNAKRKQRIVPIIVPLQNTTVDFTKTIANLYFQENHFKTVLDKRIVYFLERVRSEFHLDTQLLDDKFIHKLQLKSGRPKNLIEKIVKKISSKRLNRYISENDLVELNGLLEEFWQTKSS